MKKQIKKGIFRVMFDKPVVISDSDIKVLDITNVSLCSFGDFGLSGSHLKTWCIIPFTDKKFWNKGKIIPTLVQGQKIEYIELDNKAEIEKLI